MSPSSFFFFFSSRRRHTRWPRDWSSDVCSSDLPLKQVSKDALPVDASMSTPDDLALLIDGPGATRCPAVLVLVLPQQLLRPLDPVHFELAADRLRSGSLGAHVPGDEPLTGTRPGLLDPVTVRVARVQVLAERQVELLGDAGHGRAQT